MHESISVPGQPSGLAGRTWWQRWRLCPLWDACRGREETADGLDIATNWEIDYIYSAWGHGHWDLLWTELLQRASVEFLIPPSEFCSNLSSTKTAVLWKSFSTKACTFQLLRLQCRTGPSQGNESRGQLLKSHNCFLSQPALQVNIRKGCTVTWSRHPSIADAPGSKWGWVQLMAINLRILGILDHHNLYICCIAFSNIAILC